ncbi:MAG: response regulator [Candidatus Dormibacteraeota bacterium]|nr:response regulator [Candidatus Dormibacteraeota bacterium]MBO0744445.1 response regulator [Candidatus Dormibacteraeota bacterium]
MPFPSPRPLTPLTGDLVGARVLVVDDESIWRDILAVDLRQLGYEVVLAEDAEEAATRAAETHPEVAIVDLMLPEPWDGEGLVRRLRDEGHDFPVVYFTAFPVELPPRPDDGLLGHVTKAADRADLYELLPPALRRRRGAHFQEGG